MRNVYETSINHRVRENVCLDTRLIQSLSAKFNTYPTDQMSINSIIWLTYMYSAVGVPICWHELYLQLCQCVPAVISYEVVFSIDMLLAVYENCCSEVKESTCCIASKSCTKAL